MALYRSYFFNSWRAYRKLIQGSLSQRKQTTLTLTSKPWVLVYYPNFWAQNTFWDYLFLRSSLFAAWNSVFDFVYRHHKSQLLPASQFTGHLNRKSNNHLVNLMTSSSSPDRAQNRKTILARHFIIFIISYTFYYTKLISSAIPEMWPSFGYR